MQKAEHSEESVAGVFRCLLEHCLIVFGKIIHLGAHFRFQKHIIVNSSLSLLVHNNI